MICELLNVILCDLILLSDYNISEYVIHINVVHIDYGYTMWSQPWHFNPYNTLVLNMIFIYLDM